MQNLNSLSNLSSCFVFIQGSTATMTSESRTGLSLFALADLRPHLQTLWEFKMIVLVPFKFSFKRDDPCVSLHSRAQAGRHVPQGPSRRTSTWAKAIWLIRLDCTWEFVFHPCASSYLCQKSGEDFELPQHREFKHPQILCIQRTLSRRWLVALLCRGNCFCCWYRGGSRCWCRRLEPLSLGQRKSSFPFGNAFFSPVAGCFSVL